MAKRAKNINYIPLDIDKVNVDKFDGLNVAERQYLYDLIQMFKEQEVMPVFLKVWNEIEQMEDPITRIQAMDELLQRMEDYRCRRLNWTKDANLRISIITKLKSLDIDFNQLFKDLLK